MAGRLSRILLVAAALTTFAACTARVEPPADPVESVAVIVETSEGAVTLELWPDKAPKTVENFLGYVDRKFYDGTIFHRVIPNFMIQGGGFTEDMKEKEAQAPIKNEARTDVPNRRGTIAMARTNVVDSAKAQFFINHKDNAVLNHQDETPRGYGYAVFGKVTVGMDVVDKIAKTPTGNVGPFQDVPKTPVLITSIRRVKATPDTQEEERHVQ